LTNISSWTCGVDCQNVPNMKSVSAFLDNETETQGYVGYDEDTNLIVGVFRGTHTLTNWEFDLDGILTDY